MFYGAREFEFTLEKRRVAGCHEGFVNKTKWLSGTSVVLDGRPRAF